MFEPDILIDIRENISRTPTQRLALAVIAEAFGDLEDDDVIERHTAWDWFFKATDAPPSFKWWCSLVKLDPHYVRRLLKEKYGANGPA